MRKRKWKANSAIEWLERNYDDFELIVQSAEDEDDPALRYFEWWYPARPFSNIERLMVELIDLDDYEQWTRAAHWPGGESLDENDDIVNVINEGNDLDED